VTSVFEIPDDFRRFVEYVIGELDRKEPRDLDAPEAFKDEIGHGSRIERSEEPGLDRYRFHYLTTDGLYDWELVLTERAMRSIAESMLIEVEGTRHEVAQDKRQRSGYGLMIWGEYGDDALRIGNHRTLIEALDALRETAADAPKLFRLWTPADDQVVAVVWGELCALYVVQSEDGYATSTGDRSRNDSFAVTDHDGRKLLVPHADCVTFSRARNALINFMDHGNLGPEIAIDGRIPSSLLMMGDVDRAAALANREKPAKRVTGTSLVRMKSPTLPMPMTMTVTVTGSAVEPIEQDESTKPVEADAELLAEQLTAWAKRLIEALHARSLIELGAHNLDEISYQLGGLLQAHASDAEHSLETAEWLCNEIGTVRGINKLFATPGDLQIALRKSRET